MLQFILTDILMISVGVMLYLMVRALPRIEEETTHGPRTLIEKWVMSDMPHRLDQFMNMYLGKAFRRLKVVLLKLDNVLNARLKKMNITQNGNGKHKVDFAEMQAEKNLAKENEKENNNGGA